ncbi:hypothetical protein HDU97_004175, partial [Phlyctochytrium planicorne]
MELSQSELSSLIEFFKKETSSPWSLASKISVYFDPAVINILIAHWNALGSRSSGQADASSQQGPTYDVGRRVKSGIILAFLAVPRKKLKVCRQQAETLMKTAAQDGDEIVKAFANMVLPYLCADPKDDPNFRGKATWGPSID